MITDARDLVRLLVDEAKLEPINDSMSEVEIEAAIRRVLRDMIGRVSYRKQPLAGWLCFCGERLVNLKGLWICGSCGEVDDPRTSRVNQ